MGLLRRSCVSLVLLASVVGCGDRKSPETASQILDRVLEAPPGFHDSDLEAVDLFTDGRFDEAFAIHQQWVDKHPNFAQAHYSLAEAHRLRGGQLRREQRDEYRAHLDKALTHFRRYRELAVDDPKGRATALAHMTEVLSAEGLNRLDEAAAVARRWVQEAPADVSAYHALAEVQRQQGREQEGLATLRGARKAATSADERGLYATYLVQYLEDAPQLPADDTRLALDELDGINDALREADAKDSSAVQRRKRLLILRAERLEKDPARQQALRAEAAELNRLFLELLQAGK